VIVWLGCGDGASRCIRPGGEVVKRELQLGRKPLSADSGKKAESRARMVERKGGRSGRESAL
jgi:hypothetical protein